VLKRPRIAVIFWVSEVNATLSYQHGWPRAFLDSPLFDVTPINLAFRGWQDRWDVANTLWGSDFDAIVLLHSAFSNQKNLRRLFLWLVAKTSCPKVFFIGNEYKSMPEKMQFCRDIGISLLVSQSTDARVHAMYRDALGCAVTGIPNTGCDLSVFHPRIPLQDRRIDIGYRSLDAPWYLGNNEKTEIADFFLFRAKDLGVSVDISLQERDRFDAAGYADFLNNCRAQIGTESGGDHFELTDHTRGRVIDFLQKHPGATWTEVKEEFFAHPSPGIPMRIISGRQIEAAACKTVQILFEGNYDGFLKPDEHYIPLAKNFSNADEAIRKLRDDRYCRDVTERAYGVVIENLTYERLLERFALSLKQFI
jgi:hypothetical protein